MRPGTAVVKIRNAQAQHKRFALTLIADLERDMDLRRGGPKSDVYL